MEPRENIRRLREAANLTANAVAERAGIHPSVLCRMETGKLPMDPGEYGRLLQAIEGLRAEADARYQEAVTDMGMGKPRSEVAA